MEVLLPPIGSAKAEFTDHSKIRYGTGNVKTAVIDRADIGKFVAWIIADERTLKRYVFCWTEEVTQDEIFALAKRVSGQRLDIKTISAEEVIRVAKEAKDAHRKHMLQYTHSISVRGDNTVANARKEEYGAALDARELYPDIGKELRSVEEFAKDFYLS